MNDDYENITDDDIYDGDEDLNEDSETDGDWVGGYEEVGGIMLPSIPSPDELEAIREIADQRLKEAKLLDFERKYGAVCNIIRRYVGIKGY